MNIDELRKEIKELRRVKAAISERIAYLENEIYKRIMEAQLELFEHIKEGNNENMG